MAKLFETADTVMPVHDSHFHEVANLARYGVLSGLTITLDGADLTFDVAAGVVLINGVIIDIAEDLNAGTFIPDATNPRWAIVSVDAAGAVHLTHGAAAVDSPPATFPKIPDVPAADVWLGSFKVDNADAVSTDISAASRDFDSRIQAVDQRGTAWSVRYYDADGNPVDLGLGPNGEFLGSNGPAVAPTFKVPSASIGTFPAGGIIMWHGTLATIPAGWVLCDGTDGAPDLRSKFVRGVPSDAVDPGTLGGSATHQHVADGGHGGHGSGGNHAHNPAAATGSALQSLNVNAGGISYQAGASPVTFITLVSATAAHAHSAPNTASSGSHSHGGSGGSHAHDVRNQEPPYYSIAFIMKT